MLTGVYKPTAGQIVFDGTTSPGSLPTRSPSADRPDVPEHPALPQHDRSGERDGRDARALEGGIVKSVLRTPGVKREERGRRAGRELLAFCGLQRRQWEEWARSLSYGDQRRLEVARALATQPKLLLLDEPTAGMNPQETADFTFVARLEMEEKLTVLLIEHDMKVVMGISDRVTVLDYGEKIAEARRRVQRIRR